MLATVGHFEIPARDPERAARFYREVFGWVVEPLSWEGGAYFKIRPSVGGADPLGGGLTAAGELGAEHPLLVIHLEGATLEEALDRIEAGGGRRDGEISEVGEMGRFARFRDPEGNLLGLWSAL